MNEMEIPADGWHRIVRFQDNDAGLDCIVSVHDVTLGPGCGGCRVYPYATFEEGLEDVKRLSMGMTYKNALAGIPFGGGKTVVFADPKTDKTPEMMHALGRAIDSLEGLYYTAEDSGMAEEDIRNVRKFTPYAAGASTDGIGGIPSPHTARGIWRGIEAAVRHKFGRDSLDGVRVAILGVGAVGMPLAEYLYEAGCELVVADVNQQAVLEAVSRFNAREVSINAIAAEDVDVFSPCALGGTINTGTIDRLKAAIVAGAANNQLETREMGDRLHQRDILYAPDYVINAAGVISVALEIMGEWTTENINRRVDNIGITLSQIFERSSADGLPTHQVADRMAEAIISEAKTR